VLFGVIMLVAPGAGRARADLGDRLLRHRVRHPDGDGGVQAEEPPAGVNGRRLSFPIRLSDSQCFAGPVVTARARNVRADKG
jgi:hypothetical protein